MINQQALGNKLTQKIFNNYQKGIMFGTWAAMGGSIGSSIGELVMNPTNSTTLASSFVLSIREGMKKLRHELKNGDRRKLGI